MAIFLVLPFILKLKHPRLEIYPAIIFPSGAGLINNDSEYLTSSSFELFGYNLEDRGLSKINKRSFMNGIPLQYLYDIKESDFGLKEYRNEFKLYKPPIKFIFKNHFTEISVQETQKWLRKRLQNQNLNDSVFILRNYQLKYNIGKQRLESKKLMSDKIFKLYE